MSQNKTEQGNELFPIFLKLNNLRLLIVGGGNVGLEKLHAILQNAPATSIKLVSISISEDIKQLAATNTTITLHERAYHIDDMNEADLVIAAVNDIPTSEIIRKDAQQKGKLVNVADKPELCDFYLSSVVKKGNIKIAISTNGKSPTIAKRLKQVIADLIPDEMEDLLENIQTIRKGITGDFNEKVKQLNDLTKVLIAKEANLLDPLVPEQKKWPRIVMWILLAFLLMIVGHGILSYVHFNEVTEKIKTLPQYVDTNT
ncbi:MAG: bifunctional precorrin-2 dehydrogenase/sirohydrochlorin ferrochelatase, partial [Sphingobacteriales bacterium]|nr:bifunctional precorrin-2 dehydrogenase/sirohydrochlorin ferrochelatase [Sphingobacteriales bacterium]